MAHIDHLDLVVTSLERSLPFYRDLLQPLGWRWVREVEGERGETIPTCSVATDVTRSACANGSRRAHRRTTATR